MEKAGKRRSRCYFDEETIPACEVTGNYYFHGQIPEGAIDVGRQAPGQRCSAVRQPLTAEGYDNESLKHYRLHAATFDAATLRRDLAGKDLAWCPRGQPCHADVLLDLGNP
jgi:hypothetical protein